MKVLIIGKNGQLAWELLQTLPSGVESLSLARDEIDLTCLDSVRKIISNFNPMIIINASAYTAVDKAESEIEAAYAINETGVKNLAIVAQENNARLIHVSTDFIFDGTKNTAYEIDDITNPISVYGSSKLAGERAIKEFCPENSIIVRTSWVYSSHGNNFVKTMLKLMQEKDELSVVSDQVGCPTYARGLAKFLWCLALTANPSSIYHWTDLGLASWYDFAFVIQGMAFEKGLLTKKIPIRPIHSSNYPTPAKRPKYSLLALNNDKLNVAQYHWQTNLATMLDECRLENKES